MICLFKDAEGFKKAYPKDIQYKIAANVAQALMSEKAPTLAVVKATFGYQFTKTWLSGHLQTINMSSNSNKAMTDEQVKDIANICMLDPLIKCLKVTEILLFIYWLRTGKYGDLYGKLDTISILSKIRREFNNERIAMISACEKDIKTKSEEPPGITYDEWVAMGCPTNKPNNEEDEKEIP